MTIELKSILPASPKNSAELKIDPEIISNQILKELYVHGKEIPRKLAKKLRVDVDIVQQLIAELKKQEVIGMVGGSGLGADYQYGLYPKGTELAKNVFERDKYLGPAPVNIEQYVKITEQILRENADDVINRKTLEKAFSDTVGYKDILFQIGQVVCARKPAFVYGFPGNGKTFLCATVAKVLPPMIIPYAVEVGNQLVRIFDPTCHKPVESFDMEGFDERWIAIQAPMIVTGGELTLDDLEVKYNEKYGCYDAPPQVKATGGVLLIDDLGRQRCSVEEIFNRFIIPLENKVDFLVLGGQRMEVPTNEIILFSTNIDPMKIVDDAFLRRLPYKINVRNPRPDEYKELWKSVCEKLGLLFDPDNVDFMSTLYARDKRGMRAVHPRDLLNIINDRKKYLEISDKVISEEELTDAYELYFVTELKLVERTF